MKSPMIAFGESLLERRSDRALRILVIDDDELSRELLTLLLEVDGYEVVSAASGDEGLARLRDMDIRPRAVLTDLQMPGISGTDLACALRPLLASGVPVIAMSGSDSRPPGALVGTPPGFDGFLLKPFATADLQKMLAEIEITASASEDSGGENTSPTPRTAEASSVAAENNQAGPALNEEIFLKMRELISPVQLGQMYELCIADARTRIAAMRSFTAAGDVAGYRREAHAIKGGAGMIGAAELCTLATNAEQESFGYDDAAHGETPLAASEGTTAVKVLLDQLSRACERLERILVERLHP
jgi:CheY-like chemotaxis protein/HPt (histidine-containing phosphotransfer) domain-containing protein